MKTKKKRVHKDYFILDVIELCLELIGPIVRYSVRAVTKIFD
ncbi:hypothetical protein [Neobacillus kokaensis]|uniref:Transposase n=1 Tax=Neobacillus kokaensis TaxID=2759023 RepID=A0ABQ3N913_9BACI|nr:hypothetical protein [Neobacillus kokaensis]GHI00820.1 hypothetical protein AM1BK_43620 [Neobacillus kokaensis]